MALFTKVPHKQRMQITQNNAIKKNKKSYNTYNELYY